MGETVRSTSGALNGVTVLVVEDDFLVLSELEALLRDAGAAAVLSCRSVGEATAMLEGREPAVAILDVRIGHDSVAPVARQLAARGTPFLFYTGQVGGDHIMAEWRDRLILSKPSSSRQIVGALVGLLDAQPMAPRRSA